MNNSPNTPIRQDKYNEFIAEKQLIDEYLTESTPKTARQIADETGIWIGNVKLHIKLFCDESV